MCGFKALKVAQSFSCDRILLQCDYSYVVLLFSGTYITVTWKFYVQFSNRLHFINNIKFRILHRFHKGNYLADILSKKTFIEVCYFLSFSLPKYCNQAHRFNLLGINAYRFT